MNDIHEMHIERLRAATLDKLSLDKIPEWLCRNTMLAGEAYSFADHEYQERILRDTSREVNIRKCAQVGMSETSARLALALVAMIPYYTIIYTLPTATFASVFMNTRISPIIQSSAYLADAVNTTTDNAEVKRFSESYLYMKGSQSTNAAISVPANCLIHDEIDFSDQTIISQYQSRTRHAKDPRTFRLSTPTIPDFGIDEHFTNSRRWFNFVRCHHCGHMFIPDFYKHVRIPGFKDDIRVLTKNLLSKVRWQESHVECPSCGGTPSLQFDKREWVCENPSENHVAVGYQVSPFDAPNVMTVPSLVEESTKYLKRTDFDNFGLGIPAEDLQSTITLDELKALLIDRYPTGGSHVMGLDMGLLCHCIIMSVNGDGKKIIVHKEAIPVGEVRRRRKQLAQQYRVRLTVVDSLPYTETVLFMQGEDRNLYGAVYVNSKGLEAFKVKNQEEDSTSAQLEVRQVSISRNTAFDLLMDEIKNGDILVMRDENDEEWMSQMRDMKRGKEYNADTQLVYVWKKSSLGNDHYHNATLYATTATQMLGAIRHVGGMPFHVGKFKVKSQI